MSSVGNKILLPSKLKFFSSLLLLIISLASASKASEIERYWTTTDHFTWIQKMDPVPDSLEVYLNNELLSEQTMVLTNYKGSIHLRVPLRFHVISTLEIVAAGKDIYRAEFFTAANHEIEMVPDDFVPLLFHFAEKENECTECHRLSLEDRDLEPPTPKDSICYSCHNHRFQAVTHQHKASGILWKCLICHQTEYLEREISPDNLYRFSIRGGNAVAPLCYSCHPQIKQKIAGLKYIHGPVGMAGCNECHNPHGSNLDKFIKKDINIICVECHNLQKMYELSNVHPVMKKEGCRFCHEPHGSAFRYQLIADTNDLCYKCHPLIKKMENNHPVNGHPVSGPRNPLYPDKPFSCVSCHNSHSSDNANYLFEADTIEVCITCHPMEN